MAYQIIQNAKVVQCDETGAVGVLIGNKVSSLGGGGMTVVTFDVTYDGSGGCELTKASHTAKEICDLVRENSPVLFISDHYGMDGAFYKRETTFTYEYQPALDFYSESVSINSAYVGGNIIADSEVGEIWAEMN